MARKSRLAELLKDLPDQPTPRLIASKRNGRAGAEALRQKYDELQRTAWGEKAGAATIAMYGRDYYGHIAKAGWELKRKKQAEMNA